MKLKPRLGPGLVLAILASLWVLASRRSEPNFLPAPGKPALARVQTAPPAPLWKPTPATLLGQPQLNLTDAQRVRLQRLESEWQREAASLQQQMAMAKPERATEAELQQKLAAYSELSALYNRRREAHWQTAQTALTPAQRKQIVRPGGAQ